MRRRLQAAQGFTLLEILVVMLIIGIVISFAAISLSSGTRSYEIKAAAKRLYAISNLALEEAIVTNTQLGMRFDIDMESADVTDQRYLYQWLFYDAEKLRWLPINDHEVLHEQMLPQAIRLELEVEGQPLIIGGKREKKSIFSSDEEEVDEDEKDPDEIVWHPDIYFLSSGELVEFTLRISDLEPDSPVYTVKGEMAGKITFILPGDDEEN